MELIIGSAIYRTFSRKSIAISPFITKILSMTFFSRLLHPELFLNSVSTT